jgi:hypothetical protein
MAKQLPAPEKLLTAVLDVGRRVVPRIVHGKSAQMYL